MAGNIKDLDADTYALLGQIFKPDVVNLLKQQLSGESKPITTFSRVKPGDLITAEFINGMIGAIEGLDTRLKRLEAGTSGGKLTIFRLEPAGSSKIGDILKVLGQNFSYPPEYNKVKVNDTTIKIFRQESSDTLLSFVIPDDVVLAGEGKPAVLWISNAEGETDSVSFDLQSKISFPKGTIIAEYVEGPVVPLVNNEPTVIPGDYVFTFLIKADVDMDANYKAIASIDAGATGWKAVILDDDTNQELPVKVFSLPGKTMGTKKLRTKVTVPEATTGTGILRLSVEETSGGGHVLPATPNCTIAIGKSPQLPESRIQVNLETIDKVQVKANKVVVKVGHLATLVYKLLFKVKGNFGVTVSLNNGAGWTTGDQPLPIQVSDPGVEGVRVPLDVLLKASNEAKETNLSIEITSTDPPIRVIYSQVVSVAS